MVRRSTFRSVSIYGMIQFRPGCLVPMILPRRNTTPVWYCWTIRKPGRMKNTMRISNTSNIKLNFLDLQKIQLNRGLAAKDGDENFHFPLLFVDFRGLALVVFERPVHNADQVA